MSGLIVPAETFREDPILRAPMVFQGVTIPVVEFDMAGGVTTA